MNTHQNRPAKSPPSTRDALARGRKAPIASWIAVIVMAAFIFWMSSNSGDNINHGLGIISTAKALLANIMQSVTGEQVDVSPIGHFVEFCLFGGLLINALNFHTTPTRALLLALLIGSVYGMSDEIHQLFVPDRSCDPLDWLVDTIAAFVGALIVQHIQLRRHKQSKGTRP